MKEARTHCSAADKIDEGFGRVSTRGLSVAWTMLKLKFALSPDLRAFLRKGAGCKGGRLLQLKHS